MPRPKEDTDTPALAAREGQLSIRTEDTGTWRQHSGYAPVIPGYEFKPYKWRERVRHPVVSPVVAAMLALSANEDEADDDRA
jgi:hypothetical protein